MKKKLLTGLLLLVCYSSFAQLLLDKQLQMTGGTDAERRVTNLSDPAGANDAVNAASIQKGVLMFAASTGSSGNYVVTLNPAPTAYTAGMIVNFKASHSNPGILPATLKVGALPAVEIKVGVTNNLAAGDILNNQMVSVMYDGANFQLLSRGAPTTTLPPNGPAGGDLTGTYPNPDIAANAVTTSEIANATIAAADLAATGVSAGTFNNVTVNAQGQVTSASNAPYGNVASVATGTGLTGGPITSTGTISIANTGVAAGTYSNVTVNAQGQVTGGTNPAYPTGTGANGHVTYWTGASTQSYDSDGNFFWDATNNRHGIGTTTPDRRLQVAATGTGSYEAKIGSGTVAQNATLDVIANHDLIAFQVWDDNNLTTPKLIVTRAGNVGIGNTAPGTFLQVGQNTAANNTDYQVAVLRHGIAATPGTYTNSAPAINITDFSGDGGAAVDPMGLLYVSAPRIADADVSSNNALLLNVVNDDGTGLAVTGKRNVGVGTNVPAYRLHVSGGSIGGNFGITPNYAAWASYGVGDGQAAIYNDNGTYKKLMIVGNSSAGGQRVVGIWDDLVVNSEITAGSLAGTGTRNVIVTSNGTLTTGALDARNINDNQVTGMAAGQKYLVCVYGVTSNRGNDTETLSAIGVRNCAGTNLATTPSLSMNWPDGNAPHSHCFIITTPTDGCIQGFTDNNRDALSMTVLQIN